MLLHGRGSNYREILSLAAHLPEGAAYAAVRAPIGEVGGFAWFATATSAVPSPNLSRRHGVVPWLA